MDGKHEQRTSEVQRLLDEACEAIEWLLGDDTGASSKTILAVMLGVPQGGRWDEWDNRPHDRGDFGRCRRLLKRFPQWQPRLGEVARRYPEWRPLVDEWGELTALFEHGSPQELRHRMKAAINAPRTTR